MAILLKFDLIQTLIHILLQAIKEEVMPKKKCKQTERFEISSFYFHSFLFDYLNSRLCPPKKKQNKFFFPHYADGQLFCVG